MSFRDLVLSLVADITDPAIRMDVSATLYYLRDVYLSGRAKEDEILESIIEVVDTVLSVKLRGLTKEERLKRVREIADDLFKALKLETMRLRLMRSMRLRSLP